MKRREPRGRPEFHLSASPNAAPDLRVHLQQLPCPFLAVANVSSGGFIDPDRIRVAELADQEASFEIRYAVYVTGVAAVVEPGCVVLFGD